MLLEGRYDPVTRTNSDARYRMSSRGQDGIGTSKDSLGPVHVG